MEKTSAKRKKRGKKSCNRKKTRYIFEAILFSQIDSGGWPCREATTRSGSFVDGGNEQFFMREALCEAELGAGYTSPNPAVGAVIVRDGRIIGRGHHKRCGGAGSGASGSREQSS